MELKETSLGQFCHWLQFLLLGFEKLLPYQLTQSRTRPSQGEKNFLTGLLYHLPSFHHWVAVVLAPKEPKKRAKEHIFYTIAGGF